MVLSAMPTPAQAAGQAYRFGGWTLFAPVAIEGGAQALGAPEKPLEFLLYWQDGSERAVSLSFGPDAAQDRSALKTGRAMLRFIGCKSRGGGRVAKAPRKPVASPLDTEFPDETSLLLPDGERGLCRSGELLIADLGGYRVQLAEDSPVVRAGEWDSADFCRFELQDIPPEQDF